MFEWKSGCSESIGTVKVQTWKGKKELLHTWSKTMKLHCRKKRDLQIEKASDDDEGFVVEIAEILSWTR